MIKNAYRNSVLDHCIKVLSKNSQDQLLKVLKVLYSFDKNLFEYYVNDEKVIHNLKSREDLLKNINSPDYDQDVEL